MNKTICVTSYNSTGFGMNTKKMIEKLSLFSDIICIQEHFLIDSNSKKYSNSNKIRQSYGDVYDILVTPAIKDSSQISREEVVVAWP